jgi:TonB family protein
MFDKLIESSSRGAEVKDRGRYFAVTTFLMSILLLAGVIVSIYGAEFDIGTDNLDFAQLIAPVVPVEPQPDPPKQSPQQQQSAETSAQLPMRQAAVQNINETPKEIPPISSVPSQFKERPEYGNFKLGPIDLDPPSGPAGISSGNGNNNGSGLGADEPSGDETGITKLPPPPIEKVETKKSNTVVSLGVVNGKAKSLPTPPYPPAARLAGISGSVSVQITIDFDGSVMSSRAVDGHALLKRAAEDAAKRAKFSPTLLSKQPVRATGVITYNFKKS